MRTLREVFGKPVLFHTVLWHGKNGIGSSLTGYDSRDPRVITRQLRAMQNWGGEGVGVIALTYGPTVSSFIHQACMNMHEQCNALQMPFALCMDPWTVHVGAPSHDAAMINALNNPDIQMVLNSDCYLPGKPVLDFATGCDKATVESGVPGIKLWMNGVDYDWVRIPEQANKTLLPCAYFEFNDGTGMDRNKQVWDQTKSVRIIPSLGGRTFNKRTVLSGNEQYVQLVTWNDVSEGTDVEKFAMALSA